MKIHCLIPIPLLLYSGVTAQLSPAEALRISKQAQNAHHIKGAKAYGQTAINGYLNGSQPDSLGEAYVTLWSSSAPDGLDYAGRIPLLDKASRAYEQAGDTRSIADVLTEARLQISSGPGTTIDLVFAGMS